MVKVGKYASPMDPSWVYIDSRATFSVDLSNPSGRQNSGRSAQSDVSLSFGQVRWDFWWGVLVGWLVGSQKDMKICQDFQKKVGLPWYFCCAHEVQLANHSLPTCLIATLAHRIHVQYIHLHLVDFYGFHVGKYANPMDPSWVVCVRLFHFTFL